MTEFRRIARFSKHGEGSVEVHGIDLTDIDIAYTTVWSEEDRPDLEMLGSLGVKRITPETHIIIDPSAGGRLAARALLLSAVYQGNKEIQTLVTTVPRDDEAKLADYEALGFTVDMGDTKSENHRGQTLAREAILISHQNGRRATVELSRQNIRRDPLKYTSVAHKLPDAWKDAY